MVRASSYPHSHISSKTRTCIELNSKTIKLQNILQPAQERGNEGWKEKEEREWEGREREGEGRKRKGEGIKGMGQYMTVGSLRYREKGTCTFWSIQQVIVIDNAMQ